MSNIITYIMKDGKERMAEQFKELTEDELKQRWMEF
jgi:hypothetical protein